MSLQHTTFLNNSVQFKSDHHARALIFSSICIVLIYKLWKFFLRAVLYVDPVNDYYAWEFYSTLYRVFGVGLGIWLIRWGYTNYSDQFGVGSRTLSAINILIIIPLYFLFRTCYFDFSIQMQPFLYEIFFNFFTGAFEELMFRGLLFASLVYFWGIARAAILSSFIFSIWHLDVTTQISSLIFIFIFGMFLSYCYHLGASLLSLSIFHFLWDQVRYGVSWVNSDSISENIDAYLCVLGGLALIALLQYTKIVERRARLRH